MLEESSRILPLSSKCPDCIVNHISVMYIQHYHRLIYICGKEASDAMPAKTGALAGAQLAKFRGMPGYQ
jgi:hypothetical protein